MKSSDYSVIPTEILNQLISSRENILNHARLPNSQDATNLENIKKSVFQLLPVLETVFDASAELCNSGHYKKGDSIREEFLSTVTSVYEQ